MIHYYGKRKQSVFVQKLGGGGGGDKGKGKKKDTNRKTERYEEREERKRKKIDLMWPFPMCMCVWVVAQHWELASPSVPTYWVGSHLGHSGRKKK